MRSRAPTRDAQSAEPHSRCHEPVARAQPCSASPLFDRRRAQIDNTAQEVESTIGLDCTDAIPASAKVGIGVPEILEAIVERIPAPPATIDKPLRALIFDSCARAPCRLFYAREFVRVRVSSVCARVRPCIS